MLTRYVSLLLMSAVVLSACAPISDKSIQEQKGDKKQGSIDISKKKNDEINEEPEVTKKEEESNVTIKGFNNEELFNLNSNLKVIVDRFEKLTSSTQYSKLLNTDDWQTYTSNEGRYSIKYPKNWYHVTSKDTKGLDIFSFLKYPETEKDVNGPFDVFLMNIRYKNIDKSLGAKRKEHPGDMLLMNQNFEINVKDQQNKVELPVIYYYRSIVAPNFVAKANFDYGGFFYDIRANLFNLKLEDEYNHLNVLKTMLSTLTVW